MSSSMLYNLNKSKYLRRNENVHTSISLRKSAGACKILGVRERIKAWDDPAQAARGTPPCRLRTSQRDLRMSLP